MILLWGIPGDAPIAEVYTALARLGRDVVLLNQHHVLDTAIDLCVDGRLRAALKIKSRTIDLHDVSALYLRPYDTRRIPAVEQAGPASAAWRHAMAVEDALLCWSELTPALIVNRPSAMASNNSKPYQASLIRALGLRTPDTLVTTDPGAALEFWERHGEVIYKSTSGVRSIVSRLTAAHHDRLTEIENCPTQFQQYIEGVDVRVHVVGNELFACEIQSAADDYRYAGRSGADVQARPCALPDEMARDCLTLSARLDLPLAGIDLRRTPSGEWYCFEVNPSPGFPFYEHATGQPISMAVARLLSRLD
jgi:hypothetical protein